ncbi:MAG: bifunctional folylpolyglutamate synthase/dihydrofolate synthase [Bacilli bacterium]|nr:bifunctional folylpolyglutamate synthase/dihydrofolate synthase [Bacilli bacterium]
MEKFTSISACIAFIESQKRKHEKTSLDDMLYLCNLFDNPQDKFKSIHVAGTNGKGSVVSYMASVLMEASYKVGTFTSPYIECFNERIQINKVHIPDDMVLKYANMIIDKYDLIEEDKKPSFFSFITLMAFLYFRDQNVDYAVIECGIGGLLDDTNVIKPVLSIISNISYDHMNILGNTIEEIACNKLGIVKEKTPLVTIENDALKALIRETCYKKYAPCTIVKKKAIQNVVIGIGETYFDYCEYKRIKLKMSGMYQCENASLVIDAVRYLNQSGANITKENVLKGLEKTFWLGRLELVSLHPIIILDGAHNVDGITRLCEYINSIHHKRNVRLILAISANKDKNNMIPLIDDVCDEVIFTSFTYKRSDDAINLYNISTHVNKKIEENIDNILEYIKKDNWINIFAGSLYFVSEMRKKLKKK